MLEILNFPKERFLYLIPYTPIKYTYTASQFITCVILFQIYEKSGTNENSIPNHIASHDKTKYSGTDPTAPRNFAQKLLSAK